MVLRREHLTRPKRLLSIDGGGIRGVIAAKVLLRIEDILCRPDTPWDCLADYFDFIGGTSTGSILAAGLARGMKVRELLELYLDRGQEIFTKNWLLGRLWAKYTARPLEKALQDTFGTTTLGSDRLKTLLLIVAKNVTTSHNWFFVNTPNNKFYDANQHLPLWHLIRASTAAPVFFPPHSFTIDGAPFEFIDGGVSMFNNPAFQLFLEATKEEYGIGWKRGKENILLTSVGTGFRQRTIPLGRAQNYTILNWAGYTVSTFIEDANAQQNFLMSLIAHTPPEQQEQMSQELSAMSVPDLKDLPELAAVENGDRSPSRSAVRTSNLLTYHRYTTSFNETRFKQLGLSHIEPKSVAEMDCVDQMPALLEIGAAIAQEQVQRSDFEDFMHPDDFEAEAVGSAS